MSLSPIRIKELLARASDTGATNAARGRAYEDLFCCLLEGIPGVGPLMRDRLNTFGTEEVDVVVPNLRHPEGLIRLPEVFLVECKNWSQPVGSAEVAYFTTRLTDRGCDFGVLVAANGVTGDPADRSAAHWHGATALRQRIRIVVITTQDLLGLTTDQEFVDLLHRRFLRLYASGTFDLC